MSSLVASSFAVLLLALDVHGVFGDRTEQYPFAGQLPAQQYQFLSQQPSQVGLQQSLLSAPGGLLQSSPQLAQQDLGTATDPLSSLSPVPQMPQIMASMVSVPMQAVVELMQSVETLQKKNQGLERQLSESRAHAFTAAARSNNIDQSAQKLASLAQASVTQAQNMKTHLMEVEQEKNELDKEKQDLRTQLAQSRAALKSVQDSEALEADAKRELSSQLAQHQLVVPQASPESFLSDRARMDSAIQSGRTYEPNLLQEADNLGAAASESRALPKTLIERLRSQHGTDFGAADADYDLGANQRFRR